MFPEITNFARFADFPLKHADFSEIRAILAGPCNGLLLPPLGDFGMISGKQDFRNLHAIEFDGTGVARRFQ